MKDGLQISFIRATKRIRELETALKNQARELITVRKGDTDLRIHLAQAIRLLREHGIDPPPSPAEEREALKARTA